MAGTNLLSFKSVMGPLKMTLLAKKVPIIVGGHGIGKTSIAKFISKDMGWGFAHIDGNLLKEGEIGGLPTVVGEAGVPEEFKEEVLTFAKTLFTKLKEENKVLAKYVQNFYSKVKNGKDDTTGNLRTVYAIHHVLAKVDKWVKENPETPILLFIDEINRCEHAVQQELMNLMN
jgi:MoxR-like ATPase